MVVVVYLAMPAAPVWTIGLFAIGGVLMAFLMPYITFDQLRTQFETFELHIDTDTLVRKQKGFSNFAISRGDIRGVVEGYHFGILVRTRDFQKSLYIPQHIEGFEEIRAILRQWSGPISATSERFYKLTLTVGGILTVLAHQAPHLTKDPTLLVLAHLAAAAAALWLLFHLRRDPGVDEKTRKYSWFILIWVAIELRSAWRIVESQWPQS